MKKDFWNYSIEVYKRMGSPWRPSQPEIAIMGNRVARWMGERAGKEKIQALVLGITPEIVNMAWPDQTRLIAVDSSEAMIREFQPAEHVDERRFIQGDWMNPPFRSHQFDVIIGDGVFSIPDYPDGYRNLARIISEILKPGGLFLTRVHTQSEPKEHLEEIAAAYCSGKIVDYHQLRFRLITAMQSNTCQGVYSSKEKIDACLTQLGIFLPELYRTTGYVPPPVAPDFKMPAGTPPMKATYPARDEFLIIMHEYFRMMDVSNGEHPLAHRCPIFAFCSTPCRS
jgi:SAM-dependent methyltransferase